MKKFVTMCLLVLLSNASYGASLSSKSLAVGTPNDPNPFTICVASQAFDQQLSSAYKYLRLLHSSPDLQHEPPMLARLAFLAEELSSSRKRIFQVELKSLDANLGWQLVRHSNGEIAPYSKSVSNKGVVQTADSSVVGEIDLSICADK